MTWQPQPEDAEYYKVKAPSEKWSSMWSSTRVDPSFGRNDLPRAPYEEQVRAEYNAKDGKIAFVPHTIDQEWICYQVWHPKQGTSNEKDGLTRSGDIQDLVFLHGINDFGGKFATHARSFLDEGYRVIVPDLPGHGRSSGVHAYVPDMERLADAVYLVLADVLLSDSKLVSSSEGRTFIQKRKVFVAGQSMGGFAAVLTCLKYGSDSVSELSPPRSVQFTPKISGGLFLCPMLAISTESRPSYLVELVARGISSFAGTLPLAAANKGKTSEDPTIEQEFLKDPQTYHGKLRVGTGLAVLKALEKVNALMEHLVVPFKLFHGTGDRVTSYQGSERLYETAMSMDKEIQLYDGFEHVMLRKGRDEADDHRRQRVLKDMFDWLERH